MVKARKYVVKNHFKGAPKREDYEIVEYDLPDLKNGEILVQTEFVSVDPYLRAYNSRVPVPYDQFSCSVGTVLDSRNPIYQVGSKVVSHHGWCDYYVANPNDTVLEARDRLYKLPNLQGLSNSLAVGVIGMPGATAYFGLLDVCKPQAGETVVVTGAAGAVGSIVGQIAKLKGCRVIGFAGSDDKVEWLEKDLGFDKAFNYKTVDVLTALSEAAPKGVDCYFDNVGGEISSRIMSKMNTYGRVAVCGSISSYNDDYSELPKVTITQMAIVSNQLKIVGFIGWAYTDQWNVAFADLVKWVKSGQIKAREHITEGFDNLFDAFSGMLSGDNFGKAVVKL